MVAVAEDEMAVLFQEQSSEEKAEIIFFFSNRRESFHCWSWRPENPNLPSSWERGTPPLNHMSVCISQFRLP